MNNQYVNDFSKTTQLYYDDLKKYKPLTRTKERRLLKLSKRGNLKAKNEILEANLKFVFDVAKKYTGRGVPISELISEGNIGLLKAIDKFDISKDVKFISYAVWWIKQSMLECIKKNKIQSLIELDPIESNDYVFENNTIDDDCDEFVNKSEYMFSNENDEVLKERNKLHKEIIKNLLNNLSIREKEIIESYYGLNDNNELTLQEIGEKYNLSSERVRQIKNKAFKKIRSKMLLMDNIEDLF